MKTGTSFYSFCRILSVAGALWVLAAGQAALAQTCPLSISPPNDTASVTIEASPAWWGVYNPSNGKYMGGFDFSAADNLAYFYDTVLSDTAGIAPGFYYGWCIDTVDGINGNPETYSSTLYSTCDTRIDADLPAAYPASVYVSLPVWHQINYLLNHKNGAYFWDIQIAIWALMGEPIPAYALAGPDGKDGFSNNSNGYPPVTNSEVAALTNAAVANAANWNMSCGDVIAVVVAVHTNGGDQTLNGTPLDQLTIIEYPCNLASVSGNIFLDCNGATPSVGADSPLMGVVVSLLNSSSVPVASTITDSSGYYIFADLAPGTYYVQVAKPAGYSETYPTGNTTGQVKLTPAACQNLVQNFGYADNTLSP